MGERAEVTRIISLNIREAHLKRRFRLVLSPITTVCAARCQQQCLRDRLVTAATPNHSLLRPEGAYLIIATVSGCLRGDTVKLMSFQLPDDQNCRFGVLLSNRQVLDLSQCELPRRLPASLMDCIRGGEDALARVSDALAAAEHRRAEGNHRHLHDLAGIALLAPIRPGKIMAIGKNYAAHAAEIGETGYTRPGGFIKHVDAVIAHGQTVRKPNWTDKLDYENELAVVIADTCSEVSPEDAYNHVFGYTIMVDMSARDVQYAERKEGNIMIGKNFPTAAPLGPWVVTKDEIPDPHALRLVTRVNGETRQDASTGMQIFKIPQQIAWYSHAGLYAGDIISTGSPSGTGAGYQGSGSWYLMPGDLLECEIENIGVLRNPIGAAPPSGRR